MPSQSVEAATRNEAIEAAREEYGPSVKIVGVRRIRSGGVLGFFAAERYVAEVDLSARSAPTTDRPAGRQEEARPGDRPDDAPRRAPRARAAASDADRMSELADLLASPAGSAPVGLYSAAGVAQSPASEDVVAQRRPRAPRSAAADTPARGLRTGAGSPALVPGSFAAAVQAAAAAPAATPFAPSRFRPTLDRYVEPTSEPAAEPEPAGPSPFTAALARMVADRSVSAAVSDAVERSATGDRPVPVHAEEAPEPPVFRVRAEEWVDEDDVPAPTPAPVAAPVAAPAPVDAPVPAEEQDKRAALQSALQSVLHAAGPADPDMERLLEGVLERVLAGDATADPEESTSTGRHRVPEQAAIDHPATAEMAAVRPTGPRAADLATPAADHLDEEPADDRSADDWTADWADDVRVHELRSDVVLDMRGNEVLAHREPLVMTPSMAAWPAMARTASDPAPMSMDATTVLPPLPLQQAPTINGLPPVLRSRPAVPPARRPLSSGPSTASRPAISGRPSVPAPTRPAGAGRPELEVGSTSREIALSSTAGVGPRLATVTRLVPAAPATQMTPYGLSDGDELVVRLLALGVPEFLIAPEFAADATVRGLYAALTRSLSERLAPVPDVPATPGSVLLVIGPGPDTLAAARSLAVSVRLDPAAVQWATPGDSSVLAPETSRITSLETATERHRVSLRSGTVTIVAVDAPLRSGSGAWLRSMLSIWSPDAVWGVVDATRKLEDVVPWLEGLPRLDAVVVQEAESTADPAAVLSHLTAPVARIDGARATAHRWASLLCERLEGEA